MNEDILKISTRHWYTSTSATNWCTIHTCDIRSNYSCDWLPSATWFTRVVKGSKWDTFMWCTAMCYHKPLMFKMITCDTHLCYQRGYQAKYAHVIQWVPMRYTSKAQSYIVLEMNSGMKNLVIYVPLWCTSKVWTQQYWYMPISYHDMILSKWYTFKWYVFIHWSNIF